MQSGIDVEKLKNARTLALADSNVTGINEFTDCWNGQQGNDHLEILTRFYFECASLGKTEEICQAGFEKLKLELQKHPENYELIYYIGICHEKGYGTSINIIEACTSFTKYINQAIENKKEDEEKKAIKILIALENSYENKNEIYYILLTIGQYFKKKNEHTKALEYFKRASHGLPCAYLEIAESYTNGFGVERNLDQAAVFLYQWLKKLSREKESDEGNIYIKGTIDSLKKLAKKNSSHAQYILSLKICSTFIDSEDQKIYFKNSLMNNNPHALFKNAVEILESGNKESHSKAIFTLYQICNSTKIQLKLSAQAENKLKELSGKSELQAAIYLSQLYEHGTKYIKPNIELAYEVIHSTIKKQACSTSFESDLKKIENRDKLAHKKQYCQAYYYEQDPVKKKEACVTYYAILQSLASQLHLNPHQASSSLDAQIISRLNELCNDPDAQGIAYMYLGLCYRHGFGVKENLEASKKCLIRAIEYHHHEAHYHLAELYLANNSEGIHRPLRKEAAEHYYHSLNLKTNNSTQAIEALKSLSKYKDNNADFFLGSFYQKNGAIEKAIHHLKRIKEKNIHAKKLLAKLYQEEGKYKNLGKSAKYWYQLSLKKQTYLNHLIKLADKNCDKAKILYIVYILNSADISKNEILDSYTEQMSTSSNIKHLLKIAQAYERSAIKTQKNMTSQTDGNMPSLLSPACSHGTTAIRFYQAAAQLNPQDETQKKIIFQRLLYFSVSSMTPATVALAKCYEHGHCVEKNISLAVHYYSQVSSLNFEAQICLAKIYSDQENILCNLDLAACCFYKCALNSTTEIEYITQFKEAVDALRNLAKQHVPNAFAYLAFLEEKLNQLKNIYTNKYDEFISYFQEDKDLSRYLPESQPIPNEILAADEIFEKELHTSYASDDGFTNVTFEYIDTNTFDFGIDLPDDFLNELISCNHINQQPITYASLAETYHSDVMLIDLGHRAAANDNHTLAAEKYFAAVQSPTISSTNLETAITRLEELYNTHLENPIIRRILAQCYIYGYGAPFDLEQARALLESEKSNNLDLIEIIEKFEFLASLQKIIEQMDQKKQSMSSSFLKLFNQIKSILNEDISKKIKIEKIIMLAQNEINEQQKRSEKHGSPNQFIKFFAKVPKMSKISNLKKKNSINDSFIEEFCYSICEQNLPSLQETLRNFESPQKPPASVNNFSLNINGET